MYLFVVFVPLAFLEALLVIECALAEEGWFPRTPER